MLDIHIYEPNASDAAELRQLCVAYLIESNQEAKIRILHYTQTDSIPEKQTLHIVRIQKSRAFTELLQAVRERNEKHPIVLSFAEVSELIQAMTPEVRPAGLLNKPISGDAVRLLLCQIDAVNSKASARQEDDFVYSIKAREYRIPRNKILFFESRNKRIIARTNSQEYEFYDSLDALTERMGNGFVRTHRSYLVNRTHIAMIDYGNMEISLDDGSVVYLSRSYKENLKREGVG